MQELDPGNLAVWVVPRGARRVGSGVLEEECESLAAPRVCREIRPDGTLVIGDPEPGHERWMSDLLLVDRCGEA